MTDEPPDNPNKVESWGNYSAEYRRVRDSRGEELLAVTLRRDVVGPDKTIQPQEFHIEMDALERFASREMPEACFAKPFNPHKPDFDERFKEYAASFHACTEDGQEIAAVHLSFAKEKEGVPVRQEIWIRDEAVKHFSARGIAYEKELGLTKRWYPVVRVVGLGEPKGAIWVVRAQASVEDKGGARERAQTQTDQSAEDVLWQHPFRRRFEVGDEFTVRFVQERDFGKLERLMIAAALEHDCRRLQEMFPNKLTKWPVDGF